MSSAIEIGALKSHPNQPGPGYSVVAVMLVDLTSRLQAIITCNGSSTIPSFVLFHGHGTAKSDVEMVSTIRCLDIA